MTQTIGVVESAESGIEKDCSTFMGYKGLVLASFRAKSEVAADRLLGEIKRDTNIDGLDWVSELGTKWILDTDSVSNDPKKAEIIKYALIKQQGGNGNIEFDNVAERIRIK